LSSFKTQLATMFAYQPHIDPQYLALKTKLLQEHL